jgi:diguanylate cyclase (GGDEF)-like protein/PAS domain S-box-containing protein
VRRARWLRRHDLWIRLAGCFCTIVLSVLMSSKLGRDSSGGNVIWLANGLLLAYLLLAPRWLWPAYLSTAAAALIAGSAIIHESLQMNLLYNALDIVEVGVAASLLRRKSTALPRFTEGLYLVRFIVFGVLAGPLAAASLTALVSAWAWHAAPAPALLHWLAADGVGIAVTTPVFVAMFRNSLREAAGGPRDWVYLLLLAGVTITVFSNSQLPVIFLICPFLLLVLLRMGLGWAATGALFVALAGGSLTARGYGPLAASATLPAQLRPLLLQLFVISSVFMLYCVSVVLESHKSIERRLREIVSIHRLVTENSRDVIILADFDGRRNYVSAAAQSMGGWKPEELVAQKTLELVHELDQPKLAAVMGSLREGSEGATIEYRVRKRTGEYIWVESSLRAIHDVPSGPPTGVLNLIRDINERKRTEQELEAAYRAVEALAVVDPLTGLANRRRLDQCLHAEWRRGMRERKPLSFLLLDADHFKPYNDTYGHLRGDSCLKQIAEAAQDVVARPGDLVARYGGEEFAVVLPSTDNAGAMEIAEEIAEGLRRRKLVHRENPHGIVTVSIGCATLVPAFGQPLDTLIQLADEALYRAKQSGRNRVCGARTGEEAQPPALAEPQVLKMA